MATPQDVLTFWTQAGPKKWFQGGHSFDEAIRLRFEPVHFACARGEHEDWARTPEGALAMVICLDQFPRNLYRNSAHAFATDGKARAVARAAVAEDFDTQVEPLLRPFFYLPFEHSEDLADQALAVTLCEAHRDATDDADPLKWATLHREVIDRFGRFPHRNAALGRETTNDEQAFLDDGGFAG